MAFLVVAFLGKNFPWCGIPWKKKFLGVSDSRKNGYSRITLKSQVICWDIYYFPERLPFAPSEITIGIIARIQRI